MIKPLPRSRNNPALDHSEAHHQQAGGKYLADLILGANDGLVTTFAVVAGASGAKLSAFVMVVLGLASLLADGLSMGLGNYLGQKSEVDYQRRQRQREEDEVERLPEVETEEVATVFRAWGFQGQLLDDATRVITAEPKRWVDFMMREELNIIEHHPASPTKRGMATFLSFVTIGLLPLVPFLAGFSGQTAVAGSVALTAGALFSVGAARGLITVQRWHRGGLQMLLVGGIAAAVAYAVGFAVQRLVV